jgi:hypothetical protein
VCRFHVAAGAKIRPGRGTIYKLSGAIAKLTSINLRKFGSLSYWFDKPCFHTEGRLASVLITPSLGVSYWAIIYKTPTSTLHHQQVLWHRCREKEDFCKGSLSLPIFYFVIVLFYFIFPCIFL